jgi:hypothetical protein
MAKDGLTGGLNFSQGRELFEGIDLSGSKNKPKNPSNSLSQAAQQISQSIGKAEKETVSALAATEPTDQLGRVLKQLAESVSGRNNSDGNTQDKENRIAKAFFDARQRILETEKYALTIAQEGLGPESPISQIAAGRQSATSLQEAMSSPLPSPDPVTPEGVVQIGKDSLTKAGGEIKAALNLLESTTEPRTIPPILRALIDAISPENTRSTAKSDSLIGEVEKETRLKISEVIEREGGARFKDGILENGRLTDIAPLVTAINFINSASSSLWGLQESDETKRDLKRYKELGDGNVSTGRRFALVTTAINRYLDFKQINYTGRLTGEKQKIDLARKLISHTGSDPINSLTNSELEGLTNSGGLARGGFIDWVLKVTLNAVNDNKSQANSIGLSSYDDLLRLFNNIQSLTVTPPRPE